MDILPLMALQEDLQLKKQKRDEAWKREMERWDNLSGHLHESTANYISTGVAYVDRRLKNELEALMEYTSVKTYFKAIASQRGRVFVYAEETTGRWGQEYIHLTIPLNKRNENIVSPFIVAARPIEQAPDDRWSKTQPEEGDVVLGMNTGGTWHFYFTPKGKPLFDDFVERCRTDALYRALLKF